MNLVRTLGTPGRNALARALLISLLATGLLTSGGQAGATEKEAAPALYLKVHPKIIVNLHGSPERVNFVMLSATVRADDADGLEAAKQHMPAIRHEMIMHLSQKQAADLTQGEQTESTRQELLSAVQGFLETETGKRRIKDLYFTDIVVE